MADDERVREVQRILVTMGRLGELLTREMRAVAAGLSGNATTVTLCQLALEGPQRPGAIMDLTGLTSGGVTRMVDRLEVAGLVTRTYGELTVDKRGTVIALTPSGHEMIQQIAENIADRGDIWTLFKELESPG